MVLVQKSNQSLINKPWLMVGIHPPGGSSNHPCECLVPYTHRQHTHTLHTQRTHSSAMKKIYDSIRIWSFFKRGRVYCPPKNLQHWEVAKQPNGRHENSNLHGFELHRPSSKGTELLFQGIKAIINQFGSLNRCRTQQQSDHLKRWNSRHLYVSEPSSIWGDNALPWCCLKMIQIFF